MIKKTKKKKSNMIKKTKKKRKTCLIKKIMCCFTNKLSYLKIMGKKACVLPTQL